MTEMPLKTTLLSIAGIALLSGCFSLDPFLFSGTKESGYQFDSYSGTQECRPYVTQHGPFPSAMIHQFTLASGSERIAGVFLQKSTSGAVLHPTDTLIMYFHGNTDNIDRYWARARMLYDMGYPVVTIDYRSYGLSTGTTTEQSLYDDARAVMRYISDSLGDPRVIIYGFSLGSIPSCEIASHDGAGQVIMLVLEAPIGKVETIVENGTCLDIPGSYLTTYSGDNADKIRSVKVPLLWLHGTKDATLNRETHGLPVWNHYPDPEHRGRYIAIDGAGHTTIPQTMSADYKEYITSVRQFIRDSISSPWFHAK
jgi:pimeloyl-ACP methyl ester carboxylesterase